MSKSQPFDSPETRMLLPSTPKSPKVALDKLIVPLRLRYVLVWGSKTDEALRCYPRKSRSSQTRQLKAGRRTTHRPAAARGCHRSGDSAERPMNPASRAGQQRLWGVPHHDGRIDRRAARVIFRDGLLGRPKEVLSLQPFEGGRMSVLSCRFPGVTNFAGRRP